MNDKKYEYQDYIIAFIDILGTKEKTKDDDGTFLNNIHEIITSANEFAKDVSNNDVRLNGDRVYTKVFSDNIVFAMPNRNDNIFRIIELCIAFSQSMIMDAGCFCRGAITCGQLYIDEDIVLGPALNESYYLESNIAIYPRIVFSKKAMMALVAEFDENKSFFTNVYDNIDDLFVRADSDEVVFLDYISCDLLTGLRPSYFSELDQLLESELEQNINNVKVLQKLNWVSNLRKAKK